MQERRALEPLYDAIAAGMWLYIHSAFRVVLLGAENLHMRPHQLLVSTHRSDHDVPLICARLYFGDRMWARHHLRIHFAARDDLFERGVIAGLLPPTAPGVLRRLFFRLNPGPGLDSVRVKPIRGTTTAKAVQALRSAPPDAPVRDVLPHELVAALEQRGLSTSAAVADAFRADLADLLWRDLDRAAVPHVRAFWQRRAQEASADLRRLVDLVRSGEGLLLFPEGQPSPDGAIGPLRPGLGLLVRRGRPRWLLALGIAYDPFTLGRTRACLAAGEPLAAPATGVEEVMLSALRQVTPLTCAQVVASALVEAAAAGGGGLAPAELDARLAEAVAAAEAEGRPVDPPLSTTSARRRRLSECLRALCRLGVVDAPTSRWIELDTSRILANGEIARAATEYASAQVTAAEWGDPLRVR